jgi:polyphosphate glucokinase
MSVPPRLVVERVARARAAVAVLVLLAATAPAVDGQVPPPPRTDKRVLVIDIGGTSVKVLATPQETPRSFPSGTTMTPARMVSAVKAITSDWTYDVVSIGYPGLVKRGAPVAEPRNLAAGWVGFDFAAAFDRPVKVLNDAAMQALGSYRSGTLLFLGFGTGLGSALVVEGNLVPMELGGLSYKDGTYEDYLGIRGLQRYGQAQWERHLGDLVARLTQALHPDDIVLGGGNVERLRVLPAGTRAGSNANAFLGGVRLWDQ